jgi:Flp pilus assembly pilin Flp
MDHRPDNTQHHATLPADSATSEGFLPASVDPECASSVGAMRRLMRDENGQAMVEYVILIGFMIVMAIVVDQLFATLIEDQVKQYLTSIMDP